MNRFWLEKNSRSQILGDLNAKGSIIRGITLEITKDNRCNLLWICKLRKTGAKMFLFSVFQTIICRFKRMVTPKLCKNLIKFYLQLNIKDKSI